VLLIGIVTAFVSSAEELRLFAFNAAEIVPAEY
jgi:hypothetical protein